MLVTCYCDASFSADGGTWGVYVKSELGKIEQNGRCPDWVKDSAVAEFYAVFVAIGFVHQTWPKETTVVLICTDCKSVMQWLELGRHKRQDVGNIQESIAFLMQGKQLRTKWVRGHKKDDSKSTWVQGRCDYLAKLARRGKLTS